MFLHQYREASHRSQDVEVIGDVWVDERNFYETLQRSFNTQVGPMKELKSMFYFGKAARLLALA